MASSPERGATSQMVPTSPFKALVRELIVRLPASTTSQLDLVHELEVAVVGRRIELESCVVPVVVAERPAVGDTHPRDEPPPPPVPAQHPVDLQRMSIPPRPPHGTITHIAGEEYDEEEEEEETFRDGPALSARFGNIGGVAAADGVVYISDRSNNRIRKLYDGVVSTLAGTAEFGFQNGDSDVAQFNNCRGVALDSQGSLLVADCENNRIRAVTMDGATTTLAGTGGYSQEDGPVAAASFSCPNGVLGTPDGSIYVADDHSIRKISTDGVVTTIAGSYEEGFVDGLGEGACFDCPMSMTLSVDGTLIVCDLGNSRLRRVDPSNGCVTTIEHPFESPRDVTSSSDGTLYVAASDGLYEIRNGDVSLLAQPFAHDHDRPLCCHLDEPNGLLYSTTASEVFAVSVLTAAERRAARVFPLISLWALAQRDRAGIAPAAGNAKEGEHGEEAVRVRGVLSRLMRVRVVGVLGLVLRFAFA